MGLVGIGLDAGVRELPGVRLEETRALGERAGLEPDLDQALLTRDPLDVGQAVQVLIWNPDGTARVGYRGSEWDAELASAGTPHAETMYIVGTRANVLVLSERKPAT